MFDLIGCGGLRIETQHSPRLQGQGRRLLLLPLGPKILLSLPVARFLPATLSRSRLRLQGLLESRQPLRPRFCAGFPAFLGGEVGLLLGLLLGSEAGVQFLPALTATEVAGAVLSFEERFEVAVGGLKAVNPDKQRSHVVL